MEDPKTAIVTPPACDGRISGTSGVVFSPLCGLQPPGYVEALAYLYTLPVPHKAAYRCSADHKIIPTETKKQETLVRRHVKPDTALNMSHTK